MIELLNILRETQILVPRRSPKERQKNYLIATQKKIQQYIKNGSQGNLDLSNTPIQSLPDGLKVGDDLYLGNCKNLKSLPKGLVVGGGLYLMRTSIQSLPDGLKVGGYLTLYKTQIQSLPNGLKVGGDLDLSNTPLAKELIKKGYTQNEQEELKKMFPGVKRNIYF